MGRLFTWLGSLGTLAYSGLIAYLIHRRWDKLVALPLNELGDFLAGAFGPLAILWLVLGYFQQGIELRQNSAALRLQAQELANSVEQQRELVKVAKDQYEADKADLNHRLQAIADEERRRRRAALPEFIFRPAGGSRSGMESTSKFELLNKGAICRNVSLESSSIENAPTISAFNGLFIDKNESAAFEVKTTRTTALPYDEPLIVHFTDSQGVHGKLNCRLHVWLADASGPRARITTMDFESANALEAPGVNQVEDENGPSKATS